MVQLVYLILLQYSLQSPFASCSLCQRNYLVCQLIYFPQGVLKILTIRFNSIILSMQKTILRQEGSSQKTPALYSRISSIIHSISIAMLNFDVEDYPPGLMALEFLKNQIMCVGNSSILGISSLRVNIDCIRDRPQTLQDKKFCNQLIIFIIKPQIVLI